MTVMLLTWNKCHERTWGILSCLCRESCYMLIILDNKIHAAVELQGEMHGVTH